MRSDREPASGAEEVLQESPLLRVTRRLLPDGRSVIMKEMRGKSALGRVRHERRILERLRGVPGVPRLAEGSFPAAVIALDDPCASPVLAAAPLEQGALVTLAERVARVLACVHRRGIAHRNITPDNLLVSADLDPTLIDFGLATTFAEERPAFVHHRQIAGNLGYLAPEQTGRTGHGVDQRADLYSFGATLYRLASGVAPFGEPDQLQLVHDVLASLPQPLSAHNPALTGALSDIVMRLLEKEPDRRYQSTEGVAHDLALLAERLAAGIGTPFPLGERDFPLRFSPPAGWWEENGSARPWRKLCSGRWRGAVPACWCAAPPGSARAPWSTSCGRLPPPGEASSPQASSTSTGAT